MGCLTNHWEDLLLDHVLGNGVCTQPTALYLALFTASPVTGAAETTISFTDEAEDVAAPQYGYARASIGVGDAVWDLPATNRAIENLAIIAFATASGGDWGIITHYAIMNSSTAKTEAAIVAYGTFSSSQTVLDGNSVTIAIGALSISVVSGVFSNYLAHQWLAHVFGYGDRSFTVPTNRYMGLSSTNPGNDGSGISEPASGDGYARILHNAWDAASAGVTENTGTITFNQATGAWGTIPYGFISDALTAGNLLFYGILSASLNAVTSSTIRFDDGALDLGLD